MKYQLLGDHTYIPKQADSPLAGKQGVKFNYYLSSRVIGENIDLDITPKLFHRHDMFVRKSSYRVNPGEMENCVRANLIDHMRCLGMDNSNIPARLLRTRRRSRIPDLMEKNAFSD